MIEPAIYRKIAGRPYGEAFLHVAAEQGGITGIRRYVRALGLDATGVLKPEISTVNDGEDR